MEGSPRVTFGMIVLNGEPFVRYNLRALYPFAHQIIVVEGAAPAAVNIATPDGHSSDDTLATLRDFKNREDPEGKLIIVAAEDEGYPNGFWPGEKHEQSQAYARRATGDYLWQVDVDEFYKPEDMQALLDLLRGDPDITAVSFKTITFWGSFDYITDGWYLRRGAEIYHRLFKWGPDYRYVTHRPPTIYDPQGRDLRKLEWVNGYELHKRSIQLYHYSLIFPKQVSDKAKYYAAGPWGEYSDGIIRWAHENFLAPIHQPFQVHNVHTYPSWIRRFRGQHSEQIQRMRQDIETGRLDITCRDNQDIEGLLSLPSYQVGRWLLEHLSSIRVCRHFPRRHLFKLVLRVAYDHRANRLFLS